MSKHDKEVCRKCDRECKKCNQDGEREIGVRIIRNQDDLRELMNELFGRYSYIDTDQVCEHSNDENDIMSQDADENHCDSNDSSDQLADIIKEGFSNINMELYKIHRKIDILSNCMYGSTRGHEGQVVTTELKEVQGIPVQEIGAPIIDTAIFNYIKSIAKKAANKAVKKEKKYLEEFGDFIIDDVKEQFEEMYKEQESTFTEIFNEMIENAKNELTAVVTKAATDILDSHIKKAHTGSITKEKKNDPKKAQ